MEGVGGAGRPGASDRANEEWALRGIVLNLIFGLVALGTVRFLRDD